MDKNVPKEKRFIFMGLRRGGSSITFEALLRMFKESGLSGCDVVAEQYEDPELKDVTSSGIMKALETNQMIGCFREPPPLAEALEKYNLSFALIVRDVRDCDLSWYYARHLHPVEDRPTYDTFKDFVNAEDHSDAYLPLLRYAQSNNALIVKYENFFVAPTATLALIAKHSKFEIKQAAFDAACAHVSLSRTMTNANAHNRSGMPYQALNQLDTETLAALNSRHEAFLNDMDYPTTAFSLSEELVNTRLELDSIKRYAISLAHENHKRITEIAELHKIFHQLKKR